MMKNGERWYLWAFTTQVTDTDIARVKQQIELGYAD